MLNALGVKRVGGRGSRDELGIPLTPETKELYQAVRNRANNRCDACGFASKKFHRLDGLKDGMEGLSKSKVGLFCPLCLAARHLSISGRLSLGRVIFAPEVTQTQLNWAVHAVWAHTNDGAVGGDAASEFYKAMLDRAPLAEEKFGIGASDPGVIGGVLQKMNTKAYSLRQRFLKDLRFLPGLDAFPEQVQHYRDFVYEPQGFEVLEAHRARVFDSGSQL